jgi:hypothetical protein
VSGWFVHPGYAALTALVAVPLVIHLLFRLRPPVVRWPAMDFLLAALRKTRRRSRLEQWLLLALRMLVIAAAAILVARPLVGDELTSLLDSGPASEHFVVLDDTLSMGELADGDTAFAAGARSVAALMDRLAERPGRNRLTVATTSRPTENLLPPTAVDAEKAAAFRREMEAAKPSFIARSPEAAIERAVETLTVGDAAVRALHVVADLRARDWPADGPALKALRRAAQAGVHVRLIDAADLPAERRANLGVERASFASAPAAVGVPLEVEAVVVNHSERPAENVAVEWRLSGEATPRTVLKSVPPRGTAVAKTTITPRAPGLHSLAAKLPTDRLPADDERWLALEVVDRAPILVIDGDERQREGRFLAAALDPGGSVQTGWAPTLRPLEAYRQPGLSRFRAVFFVNVPDFSPDDATTLSNYVADGGAVCWFVGDSTSAQGWQTLVAANLMPAVLERSETLSPRSGAEPDVVASGGFLRGMSKGTFLDEVSIHRRFGVAEKLPDGAMALLRGRDAKPLAVARAVGAGRTAVVLTTAGPTWNTWATNPSYVVFLLELTSFLSTGAVEESLAGDRWRLPVDSARHRRSATWTKHGDERAAERPASVESSPGGASLATPSIAAPGVYRMTLQTLGGEPEIRGRAFNVDAVEGDLRKAARSVFDKALAGTSYRIERAGEDGGDAPSRNNEVRDSLIALLLVGLIAEQAWARRCTRKAQAS